MSNVSLVLKTLQDYKDPIEGHELAKLLDMSVQNVQSAIHVLTKKGINIERSPIVTPTKSGKRPTTYKYLPGPCPAPSPCPCPWPAPGPAPGPWPAPGPAPGPWPAPKSPTPTPPIAAGKDTTAEGLLTTRVYYYLKARHITTTSYQVSDFFNIPNDQAASLMQFIASKYDDLHVTISAKIISKEE